MAGDGVNYCICYRLSSSPCKAYIKQNSKLCPSSIDIFWSDEVWIILGFWVPACCLTGRKIGYLNLYSAMCPTSLCRGKDFLGCWGCLVARGRGSLLLSRSLLHILSRSLDFRLFLKCRYGFFSVIMHRCIILSWQMCVNPRLNGALPYMYIYIYICICLLN